MGSASAEPNNDMLDAMLGDFLDESDQLLAQLNKNLLQLDEWVQSLNDGDRQRCDENLLNDMFRSAHSLKGLSAMLGLTEINHLTHKIENVFDAARHDQLPVTREVTELVFMGLDHVTALIGLLKEPGGEPVDCSAVLDSIHRVLQAAGAEKKQATQADAERALAATAAEAAAAAASDAARPRDPMGEIEDEKDIPDNYLSMFVDEADASLDELTAGLLALENRGNPCDVKRLVGSAHKIKGSAASVGLNRAAKLAHLMEDGLEKIIATGASLLPQMNDVLLKCTDGLRRHVADLRGGNHASGYLGPLAAELATAILAYGGGTADDPAALESPAAGRENLPPANDAGASRPSAEANPRACTAAPRPAETVRVDTERLDQLMDLAGQLVINKAQFSQIGDRLKPVMESMQAVRALDEISAELDKLNFAGTVRVDGAHLANEVESMRAAVRRLRGGLGPIRHAVQTLGRARDSVRELFEAIHQLDRVSDGIQKGVMDIRMVPIGPLFARFNRVVRDISRAGGKQIRLEILGEKTELDKRMIDELGDPLVHLVRNSADHGIEAPDEREAAGKPRQGAVTLEAYHRGNSIVIEVRDDGKGLDADRILRKAVDKGLVTEADGARLTPPQIYQLIWKPGLSTAEKITDVSGRGMGMDIVKTKIDELSGTVEIASERGKGTTIRIKLPLTLAILPSLMVDIAGDFFAVPMEAVTEIVSFARNQVRTVRGRPVATVRGRVISVVELDELLTFHSGEQGAGSREQDCVLSAARSALPTETTLVIVHDESREIGLAVDRVIGEEDVVIKSIAENYKNVPGVAGASILGNGRVALILDVPALISAPARSSVTTC